MYSSLYPCRQKTPWPVGPDIQEEAQTIIQCEYSAPKATSTLNIYSTTYLINRSSGAKLRMLSAFNIPYAPYKHDFYAVGERLNFTLIFPRLPEGWEQFDLVEITRVDDPLVCRGILRNSSGVYQIMFTEDGGHQV
jgi:hypothetical protein